MRERDKAETEEVAFKHKSLMQSGHLDATPYVIDPNKILWTVQVVTRCRRLSLSRGVAFTHAAPLRSPLASRRSPSLCFLPAPDRRCLHLRASVPAWQAVCRHGSVAAWLPPCLRGSVATWQRGSLAGGGSRRLVVGSQAWRLRRLVRVHTGKVTMCADVLVGEDGRMGPRASRCRSSSCASPR